MNYGFWLLVSVSAHLLVMGGVMAVAVSEPQIGLNQAAASISVTLVSSASDDIPGPEQAFSLPSVALEAEGNDSDEPELPDEDPVMELSKPRTALSSTTLPRITPSIARMETNRQSSQPKSSSASAASNGSVTNTPALPFRNPTPTYPSAARQAGFEGKALIHVHINPDGRVEACRILRSSGRRDCDESALRTITELWRFRPAERMGKPVASSEKILVRFVLKK